MSDLRRTYDMLCENVSFMTSYSSCPMVAGDLNPIIGELLRRVDGSYIYAVGGHSAVLSVSSSLMAKVALRVECQHLKHEQQVLKMLESTPCPYIVRTFLHQPDMIFMEPLLKGTLKERIDRQDSPSSILPWMIRITQAAACLESKGYAHADINPRNIIFNDQDEPVLVDFDHALPIGNPLDVGEEPYVRSSREYTGGQFGIAGARTEQFALGSIFWFIMTGSELYADISEYDRVNNLVDELFPDTAEYGALGEIIDECWRGSFDTVNQLLHRLSTVALFDNEYQRRKCESEMYYQKIIGVPRSEHDCDGAT